LPIPDNTQNERWAQLDTAERFDARVKTDAGEASVQEFGRAFGVDAFTVEGSTATILATWHGRLIRFAAACTVTVPVDLPSTFSCGWSQESAGAITFEAADGVTIQSLGDSVESGGQYAIGGIAAMGGEVFRLFGPLV
jgi:hypothetical protein